MAGKEIVDTGGEATLVRVEEIEGMPHAAVVALFNDARSKDYDEVAEAMNFLIKDQKTRKKSGNLRESAPEIKSAFSRHSGHRLLSVFSRGRRSKTNSESRCSGIAIQEIHSQQTAGKRRLSRQGVVNPDPTRNRSSGFCLAHP